MYDIGPSIDFGFEPAIYRVAQSCVIAWIPRARCSLSLFHVYIYIYFCSLFLSHSFSIFFFAIRFSGNAAPWPSVDARAAHFIPTFSVSLASSIFIRLTWRCVSMKQKCKDWKEREKENRRKKKTIIYIENLTGPVSDFRWYFQLAIFLRNNTKLRRQKFVLKNSGSISTGILSSYYWKNSGDCFSIDVSFFPLNFICNCWK